MSWKFFKATTTKRLHGEVGIDWRTVCVFIQSRGVA